MDDIHETVFPNERVRRAALLTVACNALLLSVCKELKGTFFYKHNRKQMINRLTLDLETFLGRIGQQQDEELTASRGLIQLVERTSLLLARSTPGQRDAFAALLKTFEHQVATDSEPTEPPAQIHPHTGRAL